MRVSVKARYALASMIYLSEKSKKNEYITVSVISNDLGISKIYLEQVFSQLKKAGMMNSVKGAQGGYMTSVDPAKVSVWDILSAIELLLFEKTEYTVIEKAKAIEDAMFYSVFDPLDTVVKELLQKITLQDLVERANTNMSDNSFMFYI